jgi:hypothetical protein
MRIIRARQPGGSPTRCRRWPFSLWRGLVLLMVASALGPGLQAQQAGTRVHGAQVRVISFQGAELRGELLGLEDQRLWVMDRANIAASLNLAQVHEVRIQRHQWSAGQIFRWTAWAGGITSLGMFAACTSLEASGDCASVAIAWAAAWAAVGGISGLLARPSLRVGPGQTEQIRAYARFPQGLPQNFPPPRADTLPSPPPEEF